MKKTLVTGILAAALIAGGGTGYYIAAAKENPDISGKAKQEQAMDVNQMNEMMKSDNGDMKAMMESGNMGDMETMMESGNMEDMQKMMDNGVMNFEQMKSHIKEMHPDLDLTEKQLEEHYKSMQ